MPTIVSEPKAEPLRDKKPLPLPPLRKPPSAYNPDYLKRRAYLLANAKQWQRDNKAWASAKAKLYAMKNRDLLRAKAIRYRSDPAHREQARLRVREFWERNPWYNSYLGARYRCKPGNKSRRADRYVGRGIEFHLTLDEVKMLWFRDRAFDLKQPSIDRIDNDGHYVFENCRFIERSENSRRRNKSVISSARVAPQQPV